MFDSAVGCYRQIGALCAAGKLFGRPAEDEDETGMEPLSLKYDQTARLTANAYGYKGYEFAGWNRNADGSGEAFRDQQRVSGLADTDGATVNLYAQWKAVRYPITVYTEHGEVVPATGTAEAQYGDNILLNVTPELVERCKSLYVQTSRDRTYLMYDLDVPEMLDRLKTIQGAELLCSNPCFELWLLLHYSSVRASLTSRACLKRLEAKDPGYRKGVLSKEMLAGLREHVGDAIERAKALPAYLNPSTTVYLLVEDLDQLVKV